MDKENTACKNSIHLKWLKLFPISLDPGPKVYYILNRGEQYYRYIDILQYFTHRREATGRFPRSFYPPVAPYGLFSSVANSGVSHKLANAINERLDCFTNQRDAYILYSVALVVTVVNKNNGGYVERNFWYR